jgi:hypothetical protein
MSNSNTSNPHAPAMTFSQIAEQLTLDEGKLYTADTVRKIHDRAIQKLRKHLNIK